MVLAHDTTQGDRTEDIKIAHDVTFDTMLLSSKTLEGLNRSGFLKPSPIQLHGIPLGKCGFDLLLEAKSGTGKTAVFAVISLEKLELDKGLQAVMLAPTREIAAQICDVIKEIGSQYTGLNVAVVMGGLPIQEDIAKFIIKNNVHIVVGSPGRLRYLIQDGYIDTSSVRLLVLDEADKLMEKSFQADINYIYSALPKQKQVIMSSATYPEGSKKFISQYVKNSQHVCPNTTNILLGIEQKVTIVKCNINIVRQTQLRYEELLKILKKRKFKQCLIFCNYQVRVTELNKLLTRDEWPSEQLYGSQEQTDRLDALKTLQEYKCRILISTDLAARGIDASNVDLVINFEPPFDWQTYLHRIGRAGRYGSYGIAITILSKGIEETKFNKNLGTMQYSFNLTDLWTNEKYYLGAHEDKGSKINETEENKITSANYENSSNHEKVISEEIIQDVWNEIAASTENKKVLQNFDDLNKSFEQSSHVESFTDLLQSFENGPCVHLDNSYINIEIGKVSGKDCMVYLQNSSGDSNLCQMASSPDCNANIEKIAAKRQNMAEIKYDEIETLDISKKIEHDVKLRNENTLNESITIHKSSADHIQHCYDGNESLETEQEMAMLGLPTAFLSRRDQKIRDRENKIEDEENKKQNKDINLHCKQIYNEDYYQLTQSCSYDYSITKHDYQSKHNNADSLQNYNSNDIAQPEYFGYLQDMEDSREPHQYNKNNNNKTKHYVHRKSDNRRYRCYSPEKTDVESGSSSRTSSKGVNYSDNYINWYKQLKMKTKQIEMALYLEELAHM